MIRFTAKANVAAGAAYLDGVIPSWFKQIDIDSLRLDDGTYCVLGQLYDTFSKGELTLDLCTEKSTELGFLAPFTSIPDSWSRRFGSLTRFWREEIRRRRRSRAKRYSEVGVVEKTLA